MKAASENDYPYRPAFKQDKERLHFAMTAAGVGVWEFNPLTNEISCDDRCRELLGLGKDNDLLYSQAIQFIHPDDVGSVNAAVQRALQGADEGKYDIRYRTIGANDQKLRWVHFSGQAYFDSEGHATRFGGIAQDITAHTEALLRSEAALQQSEAKFRTVISSAPVGIGVFVGRDLIIDMPNQVLIDIIGKGPDISGKPLREVMPELQGQSVLQILDDVFTSGITFYSSGSPVHILHNGRMTLNYYNITFTPLFDSEGEVHAILDVSLDVTQETKFRQNLEEAQKILEDALEMAQLATWHIDAVTRQVYYSDRLKSWLGISEPGRALESGIQAMPDHERERVSAALQWAMNPQSNGLFDAEYGIVNQETGRECIIHSQGRTFFDAQRKAVKIVGAAQDVTAQRNLRVVLENEVQQRTEELDAANEELTATNEELHAINEELASLNDRLGQSNENLQQFAHVASHDLKEPVRKIKTFLGIIEADPGTILSDKTRLVLKRVYSAADRMFAMINGVLSYSTINATDQPITTVNVLHVVEQVVEDLELLIEQKGASILYADLPVVSGAEILIYQLFLNLIINSLKFSKTDLRPEIRLSASPVHQNNAGFVRITVSDNGLGFAQQHSEQIFNMFTRLHSKDKYEGTGLGLSLCRKIVQRHGGTIEATGAPGQGATFEILLPLEQSQNSI